MSSLILTVSVLEPNELMESVMDRVVPFAMDTRTTRAITPIMMPSMVRKERIRFEAMDFKDILKDSRNMGTPPRIIITYC